MENCRALQSNYRAISESFFGVNGCSEVHFFSTSCKHFSYSYFFKIRFKLLHVATSMSPATRKMYFLIVLIIQKSIFGVQNIKKNPFIFFNTSFQYLFLFIHVQICLEMHSVELIQL